MVLLSALVISSAISGHATDRHFGPRHGPTQRHRQQQVNRAADTAVLQSSYHTLRLEPLLP